MLLLQGGGSPHAAVPSEGRTVVSDQLKQTHARCGCGGTNARSLSVFWCFLFLSGGGAAKPADASAASAGAPREERNRSVLELSQGYG